MKLYAFAGYVETGLFLRDRKTKKPAGIGSQKAKMRKVKTLAVVIIGLRPNCRNIRIMVASDVPMPAGVKVTKEMRSETR